jgi:hypothetical protein
MPVLGHISPNRFSLPTNFSTRAHRRQIFVQCSTINTEVFHTKQPDSGEQLSTTAAKSIQTLYISNYLLHTLNKYRINNKIRMWVYFSPAKIA